MSYVILICVADTEYADIGPEISNKEQDVSIREAYSYLIEKFET